MLKRGTPYMLNLQGDLIECKSGWHPYILDLTSSKFIEDQIQDLLTSRVEDFLWYWDNTDSKKSQNLLRELLTITGKDSVRYEDGDGIYPLRILQALGQTLSSTPRDSLEEVTSEVNKALNEEFIRVRTSHLTMPSSSGQGIYFRIGSRFTNWFSTIWKVVYDNQHWIEHVTVTTDMKSGRDGKPYKWKGQSLWEIPIKDFLLLGGNPILESYKMSFY